MNKKVTIAIIAGNSLESERICRALRFYPVKDGWRYLVFTETVIPEFAEWIIENYSPEEARKIGLINLSASSFGDWQNTHEGFLDAIIYTSDLAVGATGGSHHTAVLYRGTAHTVLALKEHIEHLHDLVLPAWLNLQGSKFAVVGNGIDFKGMKQSTAIYDNIGIYFRKTDYSEILVTTNFEIAHLLYAQNPLDFTVAHLDTALPTLNLKLDHTSSDNAFYRIYRELSILESSLQPSAKQSLLNLFHSKELSINNSYSLFAQYYDSYMAHVDYHSWIAMILDCYDLYSHNNLVKIVELACGTATIAAKLAKQGYEVEACDLSGHMLSIAALKPLKPKLFQHDMTMPLPASDYDLVLSLFDSVNYLLQPEMISAMLRHAYDALKSGGLFIFDISTLQNSLENFYDMTNLTRFSDGYLLHRAEYDEDNYLQKSHLSFFKQIGSSYKLFEETHNQRVYRNSEIIKLIAETEFKLVAIHCMDNKINLLTRKNVNIDKSNPRLFYILRKD